MGPFTVQAADVWGNGVFPDCASFQVSIVHHF